MPAIQENFVRWEKNSRTPQGSLERKPCFMRNGIYFINTDKLEYDSFRTAEYKCSYSQMADLF